MPLPDWIDLRLSQDLPGLRARGENQDIEYMEIFPLQVRELGKEIAAFASTNPGTILLGVSNVGDLVGLANTETPDQRDELLRRLEGICRGTIKPSVTPTVKWAFESQKTVMVIEVPKGSEPVYYSNCIPYVRHLSESRPAEPHEVIERVRDWLATQPENDPADPLKDLLGELASLLIDTIIFAEETSDRDINPWLDQWRAQYEYTASRLREIAADRLAIDQGLTDDLSSLAIALEEVAGFHLHMGCAPAFDQVKQQALGLLYDVKKRHIDCLPLSEESLLAAGVSIEKSSRQLGDLVDRMGEMANRGRLDQVCSEAAQHGFVLLKLAHYGIDGIKEGLSSQLQTIGRDLHLVETMPVYMDGGRSLMQILDRIKNSATRLESIVDELKP